MKILYQCDDNYAAYTGVSITSLFENNRSVKSLTVYILDGGISAQNKEKFDLLANKYHREIVFVDTSMCDEKLSKLNAPKYRGSYATYYKLFIMQFLGIEGSRILYIDSDTIVASKVSSLFEYDMCGMPIAMAQDTLAYLHKRSLDIKSNEKYFNAGVILFDPDRIKNDGWEDKLLYHIKEVRADYIKHEQDIMNVVFRDNICELPLRYNLQSLHAACKPKDFVKVYSDVCLHDRAYYEEETGQGVIYHFLRFNGQFAWNKNALHPYAAEYQHYKKESPWKDNEDPRGPKGLLFAFERILYRIIPRVMFLRLFRMIHDRNELI